MNKQKFIAATITTLVLFSIVRYFTPPPKQTSSQGGEGLEVEQIEEEARPTTSRPAGRGLQKKNLKANPETKKAALKLKISKPLEVRRETHSGGGVAFSKKSDFVYFKIKDGLALAGGDIVIGELSEEQKKSGEFGGGGLLKDKPEKSKLWPSSEIAFGFSKGFPEALKQEALAAIAYYNTETVMSFVQADTDYDEDILVFQVREGAPCASYLGRIGGQQPIYLNTACSKQDVIHEIMHALGFVHEQQREGRDRYVEILWPNIKADFQYNFSILPDSMVHQYKGSVFNLSLTSVMMYHDEAFSKNEKKTMNSKTNVKISPVNKGLGEIDKERLELLYGR